MRVDLMKFLYRVMEELSNAGIPIVFKGAMVLNLVIRENNPSKVERMTRDIDGDWVGEFPTMEEMEKALRKALWMFRLIGYLANESLQALKLSMKLGRRLQVLI